MILKTIKKAMLFNMLLVLCILSFPAHGYSQSNEKYVGTVSGSIEGGELYDLYKSSADSFGAFLSGWKFVGSKNKMVDYSYGEIREKCLAEAKRLYGENYPDLYLKDFNYDIKDENQPNEEYNSQVIGSSTRYRKKGIVKRKYIYSATVVTEQ